MLAHAPTDRSTTCVYYLTVYRVCSLALRSQTATNANALAPLQLAQVEKTPQRRLDFELRRIADPTQRVQLHSYTATLLSDTSKYKYELHCCTWHKDCCCK